MPDCPAALAVAMTMGREQWSTTLRSRNDPAANGEPDAADLPGRRPGPDPGPGRGNIGRDDPEAYVPGTEPLENGNLRVAVLASGNPWPARAPAPASILVEVGHPERDLFVFDLGTGSLTVAEIQHVQFTPVRIPPPAWRAEAMLPRG